MDDSPGTLELTRIVAAAADRVRERERGEGEEKTEMPLFFRVSVGERDGEAGDMKRAEKEGLWANFVSPFDWANFTGRIYWVLGAQILNISSPAQTHIRFFHFSILKK